MADLDQITGHREVYSVVWLDPLVDPEDLHTQELATKLSDACTVFADILECLSHLKMAVDQTILIISGSCAEQCIHSFHSIPSISCIVIYCAQREKYSWIESYRKVVTCVQTEADLIEYVHCLMTIKCQTSFYLIERVKNNAATSMRFRLTFECLKAASCRTHAKRDMVENCRMFYRHNLAQLATIDDFEKEYCSTDAISWYTKHSFIYKLINSALRAQNVDILCLFSFFIRDLQKQLAHTYSSLVETHRNDVFKVYRGMRISSSELNQLRHNADALVTTTSYMSTSKIREVATLFATKSVVENLEPVLFEITIDLSTVGKACFADVSAFSCFPEEEEVLFNFGSVFRIHSVDYDVGLGIWLVSMSVASTKEYLDVPELCRLLDFEDIEENRLNRDFCTRRWDAYYNDWPVAYHGTARMTGDGLFVKSFSGCVLGDVDKHRMPIISYKKKQIRHAVSFNCIYGCNCYGNNNILKHASKNVNDSSETAFSINEKTHQSDKFHYPLIACVDSDSVTNMNANHFRIHPNIDRDNSPRQQGTHEIVRDTSNHSRKSTENINYEFFVENPILCFDIRGDRLRRVKTTLSEAFCDFQTIFIADVAQIIKLAAQCQVNNRQLYLILSESLVAEFKSFETKMIRIYYLDDELQGPTCDEWNGPRLDGIYVDTIDQLTNKLYHDLARFYSKAAELVASKGKHSMATKHLLLKSARCYELLAQNTRNIIQRYQDSLI